jgi:hypothetical protein
MLVCGGANRDRFNPLQIQMSFHSLRAPGWMKQGIVRCSEFLDSHFSGRINGNPAARFREWRPLVAILAVILFRIFRFERSRIRLEIGAKVPVRPHDVVVEPVFQEIQNLAG